jgi:flagellar hook assembly protein FlgD
VYDLVGRLVATLLDADLPPGRHEATWDGRDSAGRMAAAGTYFYRVVSGSFAQTKRMTMIK